MKSIKTSKLIAQQKFASSITIRPASNDDSLFMIEYFLKEKRPTLRGSKKTILVEKIIEDYEIPEIENWTVNHIGYNTYKYIEFPSSFYINFYKFN